MERNLITLGISDSVRLEGSLTWVGLSTVSTTPMCYIYHTEPELHTSQTLSFHNNLPYPPHYFRFPDWESVNLCKFQHYPILDT